MKQSDRPSEISKRTPMSGTGPECAKSQPAVGSKIRHTVLIWSGCVVAACTLDPQPIELPRAPQNDQDNFGEPENEVSIGLPDSAAGPPAASEGSGGNGNAVNGVENVDSQTDGAEDPITLGDSVGGCDPDAGIAGPVDAGVHSIDRNSTDAGLP